MREKLIAANKRLMTPLGEYLPAQWDGNNTSGIIPIGDRVLVLWTTPTDGTLPVMAMTRDEAFRALEWLSRWLQQAR